MKITKETSSYNQRRMGKPWIARVAFNESSQGEFLWGSWTGDAYNGGEGILSINVNPGEIVAIGQKDNRQPRNSAPVFYVVSATGILDYIGDKGAAYKYFLEHKNITLDCDVLRKERETLLARIAEIDAIINN